MSAREPAAAPAAAAAPVAPQPVVLDRKQLDQIVDAVVRRLEHLVVDELERRGRRHPHGGL